jgi:hypothetical protein
MADEPQDTTQVSEENTVARQDPDVVMSPSIRADGTPDQTPGFEIIETEEETTEEEAPKRGRRRKASTEEAVTR